MKKSPEKLAAYLEKFNKWRRGCAYQRMPHPKKVGDAIDQAVEMLKKMTWQPMETAPKDREFLGVWGAKDPPPTDSFDVFRYDEDQQKFAFSNHGATIYLPSETHGPWAWMEIPKYEP